MNTGTISSEDVSNVTDTNLNLLAPNRANQNQNGLNDSSYNKSSNLSAQPKYQPNNTSSSFKQPFQKQQYNSNQASYNNKNKNYTSSQFSSKAGLDNAKLQQSIMQAATTPPSYLPFGYAAPSYYLQAQTQQTRLQLAQPAGQMSAAPTPPPFFYSSNNFNKQNYLNYKSYLQAKKAENMHKLWPHSLEGKQWPNSFNRQSNSNNELGSNTRNENNLKENNHNEPKTSSLNILDNNELNPEESKNDNLGESDNQKENSKTPMCIINELVKFNKIKHEYVLLDEIGPAHKKTFFVQLKLGAGSENEESYTANSTSIKKAQHAAAEIALSQTKFKKPVYNAKKTLNDPNKLKNFNFIKSSQDNFKRRANPALAPTVLLNSLAMKLGLVANYTHLLTTASNNIDFNMDTLCSANNGQHNNLYNYNSTQQIQSSNNDNYTNFMNSDYEPFKYAQNSTNKEMSNTDNVTDENKPDSAPITSQIKILQNPNRDMFSIANMRTNLNKIKKKSDGIKQLFFVKLKFADIEFSGEGATLQLAKHDAATKALTYFSNPENFLKAKALANSAQNKNVKAYRPPQFYKQQQEENDKKGSENEKNSIEKKNSDTNLSKISENNTAETSVKADKVSLPSSTASESNKQSNLKSEIMMVHEYAYRLKKTVKFELVQESGPSHIKKFVTKCSIGDKNSQLSSQAASPTDGLGDISQNEFKSCYFEAFGEGNSKKLSKNNSAIQILKILKEKFEPLFMISSKKINPNDLKLAVGGNSDNAQPDANQPKKLRKNKAKNIVKLKKTSPEYGKGSINPISRLIQIQQAKKEPEPEFKLIISNPNNQNKKFEYNRRHEFIIQVSLTSSNSETKTTETLTCEGRGSTKKLAKKNAAEAMLTKLGYVSKQPALKPSLKAPTIAASDAVGSPPTTAQPELDNKIQTAQNVETSDDANKTQEKTSANEKNEKRVKFLETNLTTEQPTSSLSSISSKIPTNTQTEKKTRDPKKQSQKPNYTNNKLRAFKEQLIINNSNTSSEAQPKPIDKANLEIVFKIASELLESAKPRIDAANIETADKNKLEFYSPTAEDVIKQNKIKIEQEEETERELEEKKIQFKILNGGGEVVNYKKALEFLGEVMNFKVNYQSLMSRDGNVCSYVNLSILENEKPFNGHGSTHIESANVAALSALQYLAAKLNKN